MVIPDNYVLVHGSLVVIAVLALIPYSIAMWSSGYGSGQHDAAREAVKTVEP